MPPNRCSRACTVPEITNRRCILLQQVIVDAMNQRAPHAFLDAASSTQVRAELIPQIVVLAHPVVEPQHVIRMLHRVAGKAKADHAIDLLLLVRQFDVGAPRREIGAPLLAEAILRRDDEAGVVTLLAQRANQLARHHQVSALGERRARRDDRNRRHYCAAP